MLLLAVCLLIKEDANLICGVDAHTFYLSVSALDQIEVVQHTVASFTMVAALEGYVSFGSFLKFQA